MKKKETVIFTFLSLLLFSPSGITYAQKTSVNCPGGKLDRGAVCKNQGVVINNQNGGIVNILQENPSSLPSMGLFKNPRDPFEIDRSPTQQESLISDEELPQSYPTFENLTVER